MKKTVYYKSVYYKYDGVSCCASEEKQWQQIHENSSLMKIKLDNLLNKLNSINFEEIIINLNNAFSDIIIELGIEFKISFIQENDNIINCSYITLTYILHDNQRNYLNSEFIIITDCNINSIYEELYGKIKIERENILDLNKSDLDSVVKLNKEINVIFNVGCSGKFLHELFAHSFESDIYEDVKDTLENKKIFNGNITLVDNYRLSRQYDDSNNLIVKELKLINNGFITENILGIDSGNMYSDFFANQEVSPIARTTTSKYDFKPISVITYPNLCINDICFGSFDYKSKKIVLKIKEARYYKTKEDVYNLKAFFCEFDLEKLLEKNVFSIGESIECDSLCGKSGQVKHVTIFAPTILVENINIKKLNDLEGYL